MSEIRSLKPTWGNAVILVDTPDEFTTGGLTIPEQSRPPKITGTVMALGPGRIDNDGKLHPPEYKVGDRVAFGRHVGYKVTVQGKEYKMIEQRYLAAGLKPISEELLKIEEELCASILNNDVFKGAGTKGDVHLLAAPGAQENG